MTRGDLKTSLGISHNTRMGRSFIALIVILLALYFTLIKEQINLSRESGRFGVFQAAESFDLPHYVVNCYILDEHGKVLWQLPAHLLCAFSNDGKVVASNGNSLRVFNPDMTILWQRDVSVHHQINIFDDEILLLSDTYQDLEGDLVRFDSFVIFDWKGNQIKRYDLSPASNIWPHYKNEDPWEQPTTVVRNLRSHLETSHFNSFYKITKNQSALPALAEGNYIVNDIFSRRAYVLGADLKNVIWAYEYGHENYGRNRTHDAQVLPNGNLLVYVNGGEKSPYSTLIEVDPKAKQRKVLFQDSPPENFYSFRSGGVQMLPNGNILFSDIGNGPWAFEVEQESGKKVWSMDLDEKIPPIPQDLQQVKRVDLSSFLQKNQGL